MLLDDRQDLGVDQGDEDDRLPAFVLGRVVDLAHDLVRLVGRVDERPAHVARLDRELRQDRVAEGLGGDAGAVGDEEHGAARHARSRRRCGARWRVDRPMIGSRRRATPLVESPQLFDPAHARPASRLRRLADRRRRRLPRACDRRPRDARLGTGRKHRFFTITELFPCHPPTWRPPSSPRSNT